MLVDENGINALFLFLFQLKKMHFSENWMHNPYCFECIGKIIVHDFHNDGDFDYEEGGLFFVRCPLDHRDLTFLAKTIMQRTEKVQYKFSIRPQKCITLQMLHVLR